MKKFAAIAGCVFLGLTTSIPLSAQARSWLPDPVQKEAFMEVLHSISSHDLMEYVEEMSSDKYRGRLSGTPEYMQVAEWVAGHLQEWGIKPGGDNDSYFQMFDMPYSDMKSAGALSIQMESGDESMVVEYSFPQDYYPGTNSDAGTITAEAVYVGHGITAPELGYDDYEGLDVRGKIVVIDPNTPYVGNDDETTLQWVPYSYHQFKLDNARRHGAAGLLYVGKLANPNTSYNEGLIYCHIDEHVVDHLFFESGKTHSEVVEEIQGSLKPASFSLGKTATITAELVRHPEGRAANVIGIIEGSDPILKDEVIIIGGHLDAVGYLGELMPGALDNASGVADILGAAKALAASPAPLKRSIMFLFIGGEECGLVGSTAYTEGPVFPKEKTVMFFNLDMVGHGTGLSVGGGLTYPQIYSHFEAANAAYLHRPLRTSESRVSLGRPRSDSVIFQRAGFRTMSFGTSGRIPGMNTYYHDPRDTPDTLTPEIMEDVVKLIFVGLTGLANDRELSF
jgi:hypothetical protein